MNKYQTKLKEQRRKERLERTDKYAAAEIAVTALMVIPAYILHTHFGFGNKRIEKFIQEFKRLWDLVRVGKVSLDTLASSLDAETGIIYDTKNMEVLNRKG